jgi:hypothetical protein
MGCMGNTHFVEQDHVFSLLDIQSPFYKWGIKLLDGLHIDSAYTDRKYGLHINNNDA